MTCSCRRLLTEDELFHAYGLAGTPPEPCDAYKVNAAKRRIELDAKRARAAYAANLSKKAEASANTILRRLREQEHFLKVGGR